MAEKSGPMAWIPRLVEKLRLNTCFWVRYKIDGPKAGTKPKVIGLLTSPRLEAEAFKSRTAHAEVKRGCARRSNQLRTYKYTLWDFLPRAILIQFQRFANSFYLCVMIITAIGFYTNNAVFFVSFSPVSILVVVAVVVAATLLIEGLNDIKRHTGDRKTNKKPAERLADDGTFHTVRTGDIHPGDIVLVRSREQFPADCLLIATECFSGVCYIETSEIDGETNLKIKEVPEAFNSTISEICESAIGASAPVDMDESAEKQMDLQKQGGSQEVSARYDEGLKLCDAFEDVEVRRRVAEATHGLFEYEEPNAFLQFNGRFISEKHVEEGGEVEAVPLDFPNLILRGSVLRNTKWVLGVVMYAGAETKIVMSKDDTRQKYGLLDAMVNLMLHCVFVMYVLLCILFALILTYAVPNTDQLWYFMYTSSTTVFLLPVFWAFLLTYAVLLAQFIPITIYLCVEVAAFLQQFLIHTDLDMYHAPTDTSAGCRSSGLVAEIGQVTDIFSDKTGTLTNNNMVLVGFYTEGQMHGFEPAQGHSAEVHTVAATFSAPSEFVQSLPEFSAHSEETIAGSAASSSPGLDPSSKSASTIGLTSSQAKRYSSMERVATSRPSQLPVSKLFKRTFELLNTSEDFKYNQSYLLKMEAKRRPVREFLMLIALCHTVVIEKEEDGGIRYNAEGPDEEALVKFAAGMGFQLCSTSNGIFQIRDMATGNTSQHKLLALNPFDSTRKRMSVIMQTENMETGEEKVELLIKGADNVVFERLRAGQEMERSRMEIALKTYSDSSWKGLRTLVMARRKLEGNVFTSWHQRYIAATSLPGDERIETLLHLAEEIETDLDLLGASAIEDELQDGVPETIEALRQAGIRLWVATGDKLETAVNIALSANLLDQSMLQIVLQEASPKKLKEQLSSAAALIIASIKEDLGVKEVAGGRGGRKSSETPDLEIGEDFENKEIPKGFVLDIMALLVTGEALEQLLKDEKGEEELEQMFLQVAQACKIILACRVSPKQKALLVKLVGDASVFDWNSPVTLAIGDGANDVPMIQAARIGVGISGREGLQAANSADFSFAQFRFLQKLLLVHGHWNYRRGAMLVTYVTYSQIVFTFGLAFYLTVSLYSGQQVIVNPNYLVSYGYLANIPIIFSAVFNKDASARVLLENPWTYAVGRRREDLNLRSSMIMLARALVHSGIIWIGAIVALPLSLGLETMGATIFTAIMLVMFHQQITLTSPHNYITVSIYFIFIIAFLLFMTLADQTPFLWNPSTAPMLWLQSKSLNSKVDLMKKHVSYVVRIYIAFWVLGLIAILDFAVSFVMSQYMTTPLQVLSEISVMQSNDQVQHVLQQAGEALTLPIRVPAKVVLDKLRELEEKAPGNIHVLPRKAQTRFAFDFTSIGFGALLPIKAITKKQTRRWKRKAKKPEKSAPPQSEREDQENLEEAEARMQRQSSSMHADAYKRFTTFGESNIVKRFGDSLGIRSGDKTGSTQGVEKQTDQGTKEVEAQPKSDEKP